MRAYFGIALVLSGIGLATWTRFTPTWLEATHTTRSDRVPRPQPQPLDAGTRPTELPAAQAEPKLELSWHGFVLLQSDYRLGFVLTAKDPLTGQNEFEAGSPIYEVIGKNEGKFIRYQVPDQLDSTVRYLTMDKEGLHGYVSAGHCQFSVEASMAWVSDRGAHLFDGTLYQLHLGPSEEALAIDRCRALK